MSHQSLHVAPRGVRWSVRRSGSERAIKLFSWDEAVARGTALGHSKKSDLFIHWDDERISIGIISGSKFSIHDLSRCFAGAKREIARLNMPLELGINLGCKQFGNKAQRSQVVLILEEQPYRYLQAVSDLNGSDIVCHDGKAQTAVKKVRDWLVNFANAQDFGPTKIMNAYD